MPTTELTQNCGCTSGALLLKRYGRELQPRNPSLGTCLECGDSARRQSARMELFEQVDGLVVREAQVRGARFSELPAGAKPGQWQRRVGSRGENDVHVGRHVIEQEGYGGVNGLQGNGM